MLGIHREFRPITDRSCLNKFLTEVKWSETELSVALHGQEEAPAIATVVSLPLDDVLIDHDGQLIKDVGRFGIMPNNDRFDYLFANYVHQSASNPLANSAGIKPTAGVEAAREIRTTRLKEPAGDPRGDFVFDSYFTNDGGIHGNQDRGIRPAGLVGRPKCQSQAPVRRNQSGRPEKAGLRLADEQRIAVFPLGRRNQKQWCYTTIRSFERGA